MFVMWPFLFCSVCHELSFLNIFIRDILLGLMKRLVKLRASNLKVLVTSATLDGEKVSRFFSNCPILNVPGKLFPVEILHSSERPKNYIDASLKAAISKIEGTFGFRSLYPKSYPITLLLMCSSLYHMHQWLDNLA